MQNTPRTNLEYLVRMLPLYQRDPAYSATQYYDVVYCDTCWHSDIEPEVRECEACGLSVCPYCCGQASGYHEICRQQVDGDIDPLLDRRTYLQGYLAGMRDANAEAYKIALMYKALQERLMPEMPKRLNKQP